MRQGECLGLTVDRLDFLRRVVHVDRQLVTVTGRPSFTDRTQDGGERARHPAAASRARCSPRTGRLPPLGDGFVFVTAAGNPIRRTAFGDVWRAAIRPRARRLGRAFISCGISMPAC